MRKRWRLCLVLMLLLLVSGLLLIPSVRWPVYGWFRGEAFYEGMPTSWWAKEIEESVYCVWVEDPEYGGSSEEWCVKPTASLWQWLRGIPVKDIGLGSPLLMGDPHALPVLLELIRGDSAKGRRVAIRGLLNHGKREPEIVRALLAAIGGSDDEVRQDAIDALQHIDREAAAKAGVK